MLALSTVLVGGAVAACFGMKSLDLYLMDVIRGYVLLPRETDEFSDFNLSLTTEFLLTLVWVSSSVLLAAAIVYRDGHFGNLNVIAMFTGYHAVPSGAGGMSKPKRTTPRHPSGREPAPNTDAFNMFDPADLPPRLAEYANMVYSACEDLGNFFGFQDSSVRNQAEHLLILLSNNRRYMSSHILPPSVQPPSPIHALHAKVFSNYMKWCRAMSVPPNFSKMNTSMSAPPAVASRVVDLVLWFCIWGEGSNLRHMPECLWFLYHKMMEEYTKSEGYTQTRSLYAGHYLDRIVAPIYDIVMTVSHHLDHVRFVFTLVLHISLLLLTIFARV
jgi:callose synthase